MPFGEVKEEKKKRSANNAMNSSSKFSGYAWVALRLQVEREEVVTFSSAFFSYIGSLIGAGAARSISS